MEVDIFYLQIQEEYLARFKNTETPGSPPNVAVNNGTSSIVEQAARGSANTDFPLVAALI